MLRALKARDAGRQRLTGGERRNETVDQGTRGPALRIECRVEDGDLQAYRSVVCRRCAQDGPVRRAIRDVSQVGPALVAATATLGR